MSRAFYYIAALALAASCARVVTDPLPATAERFDPPPAWQVYLDSMRTCSGLTRTASIDELTWYRAPDGALGEQIAARWDFPHRVILTAFYADTQNGDVIMHELLHDLLGSGEHPPVFDRCHVNN